MNNALAAVIITGALSLTNDPSNVLNQDQGQKEAKNSKTVVFEPKKDLKRSNQKTNKVKSKKYNRLKGSKDTK